MRFVQAATMLLGAVMYGVVIAFAEPLWHGEPHWLFFIVGYWNTLLLVVAALAAADSIRRLRAGETRALATDAMVVKLVAIPFFLLNFFVLGVFTFGGMMILVLGGAFLLFGVWVGSGLTYLVMLSTSIYIWAAVARLRRERVIGSGLAVLYGLLSLVFIFDVVAAILVFGHSRRRAGRALVSVLLAIGAILIGISFIPTDLEPLASFDLDLRPFAIAGGSVIGATVIGVALWMLTIRRRQDSLSLRDAE